VVPLVGYPSKLRGVDTMIRCCNIKCGSNSSIYDHNCAEWSTKLIVTCGFIEERGEPVCLSETREEPIERALLKPFDGGELICIEYCQIS